MSAQGPPVSEKKRAVVYTIVDDKLGLRGFLAVDSTVNRMCAGGVRMASDITAEEILQLARVMTWKYGFLGLPVGGAKAGIAADPALPGNEKRRLLEAFGRGLKPVLKGLTYFPGSDLGTNMKDVAFILRGAGFKTANLSSSADTARYTGLSAAVTGIEAGFHLGLSPAGLTLAVEGFGKVGRAVAQEFDARGVRLTAFSTICGARYHPAGFNVPALLEMCGRYGDEVVRVCREGVPIDKAKLFELDVDILSPCARPFSINKENASRIRAKIISPGANIAVEDAAEDFLHERKIICVPDFIANCGGVLGANMKAAGLEETYIRDFIVTRLAGKWRKLMESPGSERTPLSRSARQAAMRGFLRSKEKAEKWGFLIRFLKPAESLFRKGLIPKKLVSRFSRRFYDRSVLVSNI